MSDTVVLVVDDSPTVRKIVQMTLQRENITVIAASDGLGALAAVVDYQPDLILLDIILPHMDGYSICQIIRKKPESHNTPILMLSSRDKLFDRMRGKLVGANDYLTKPFDATELVATVHKYLENAPHKARNSREGNQRFRQVN